MTPSKIVRKKIYVDKMVQGRTVMRLVMYWVTYHVVLWHAMFLYRFLEYRENVLVDGTRAIPFAELYGEFALQHYSMVVCAFAVLPIVVWDLLKLTHRIAGPMVRFERVLRDLAAGKEVKKVTLRKGDLTISLQNAFNDYLDTLNADKAAPNFAAQESATAEPTAFETAAAECSFDEQEHERLLEELLEIQQTLAHVRREGPRDAADDRAEHHRP